VKNRLITHRPNHVAGKIFCELVDGGPQLFRVEDTSAPGSLCANAPLCLQSGTPRHPQRFEISNLCVPHGNHTRQVDSLRPDGCWRVGRWCANQEKPHCDDQNHKCEKGVSRLGVAWSHRYPRRWKAEPYVGFQPRTMNPFVQEACTRRVFLRALLLRRIVVSTESRCQEHRVGS
jgi:hypothetical protein